MRFGAPAARVEVDAATRDGRHELAVGFQPGRAQALPGRRRAGRAAARRRGAPARHRLPARPPRAGQGRRRRCGARTSTRSSPRCGPPAAATRARLRARRSRSATRCSPAIRAGRASRRGAAGLGRRAGAPRHRAARRPRRGRRAAAPSRSPSCAAELGLDGDAELRYRPRRGAATPEELAAELAERLDADLERGFTGHGPHRDDLALAARRPRAARLRLAGRAAPGLLALLLAEREALAAERGRAAAAAARRRHERARRRPPRAAGRALAARGGQSVSPPPTSRHVPGAEGAASTRLAVADGRACSRSAAEAA